MTYEGYLDYSDERRVSGWAFDRNRPDTPLVIELNVADEKIGNVLADQFRPDLQQFGNGRHAFSFRLPSTIGKDELLTARIAGTDFGLPRAPGIALLAGDIVNQCNLRCPFCMVDYTNTHRLQVMSREIYDRALELLPFTMKGRFWLSCLHEPTLHPQLVDFIEAVPDVYRDRISFTTNLSWRMNLDTLSRIAHSGVHEVRVSLDSLNADVFSNLRRKGKFDVFKKNLVHLSDELKQSRERPRLHLITMAFKDNYREMADIVRFGRDLGADSHEIRYMYYYPFVAKWGKDHLLDLSEWADLEQTLAPLASDTLVVSAPNAVVMQQAQQEAGLDGYVAGETAFGGKEGEPTPIPEPADAGKLLPDKPLELRLRWDGLLFWEAENLGINVGQLDQPASYLNALRLHAANRHVSGDSGRGAPESNRQTREIAALAQMVEDSRAELAEFRRAVETAFGVGLQEIAALKRHANGTITSRLRRAVRFNRL